MATEPSSSAAVLPGLPPFAELFRSAWGYEPFAWQRELADLVQAGRWPSLLDVPTGMGKTAALDVFVWHLASQAGLAPTERTAPLRAAFVIDRRLVVDSAFVRMRTLTQRLHAATDSPGDRALWAVAERLRWFGATRFPLVVQRMRGGITWEAQWVRQPDQPAIVCGTVDQIGSRMLQRGYGSSRNRMPIDTGLLGVDCLIMVDEAHLSSAMVTSVNGIARLEQRAPDGSLQSRSGQIVRLTATPPDREVDGVLRVDRDAPDASEGDAVARLTARKRAVLVGVKKPDETVRTLMDSARVLIESTPNVVLVVCNTVARARAVYDGLSQSNDWDTRLLIGRCRSLERREAEPEWFPRAAAGRVRSPADRPLMLVATQTIEVGVDLDADAIVTEVASADALVQRFGRVDRLGLVGDTLSIVVGCPSQLADEPVYGSSADTTWALLATATEPISFAVGKNPDARVVRQELSDGPWFDAGPIAFRELIDSSPVRHTLFATAAPAPVILPQTLACWARTSPVPDPDEAVAPYLHGVDRGNPVVSVLWRAQTGRELLKRFPIRGDEMVEIPLKAFRYFLRPPEQGTKPAKGTESDGDPSSDLEGRVGELDDEIRDQPDVDGFIVRSRDEVLDDLRLVRPGDVVVLASGVGGHDDAGWTGRRGGLVADIADLVERRSLRLRLDAGVLATFGVHDDAVDRALTALSSFAIGTDPSLLVRELIEALDGALQALGAQRSLAASVLAPIVGHLRTIGSWAVGRVGDRGPVIVCKEDELDDEFLNGLMLVAPHPVEPVVRQEADDDSHLLDVDDDSDDTSLLGSGLRVDADLTLLRHSTDVSDRAATFAQRCGYAPGLVSTVAFAGFLHDLGKAETRFQAMLRRGDLAAAEACADRIDKLLAKSDLAHDDVEAARAATRAAGWPGLRHEAISLALARTWPASAIPADVDIDLAMHLVATHHGYARPWFPADRSDPRARPVSLRFDATVMPAAIRTSAGTIALDALSSDGLMAFDQPDRFERVRRRYGFWGLCHLEAVLRLADMTISEELGWELEKAARHG